MASGVMELTIRQVGRSALLIERVGELGPIAETLALVNLAEELRAALAADGMRGIDVVPGAATVLVDTSALATQLPSFPSWVRRLVERTVDAIIEDSQPAPSGVTTVIEVPVTYDGPDLQTVAHAWGTAREQVAARHTAQEHVVAFCGFAPGFAYVRGDAALPDVPRLATPRVRVEPGAVGLAGPFTGVYPGASPGGWQIIGRTGLRLWDLAVEPPALLVPGARVRFVEAV